MPTYCFFDIRNTHNEADMAAYREKVMDTVAAYQGRYVAVGGPAQVVEGSYQPVFPVIIEFPSMEQANQWYNSPEYTPLKQLRLGAVDANAFFVQGF